MSTNDSFVLCRFIKQQKYSVIRCDLIDHPIDFLQIGSHVKAQENISSELEDVVIIFIGSFMSCHTEFDLLLKDNGNKLNDNSSDISNSHDKTKKEFLELQSKYDSLQQSFDYLNNRYEESKREIVAKDKIIANLKNQLELKQQPTTLNNSCYIRRDEFLKNMVEIKSMIKSITTYSASKNESSETPDNMVKLAPTSSIMVSKARYIHARSSLSASAFVIKILTGVFGYNEIMSSTLFGQSNKRKECCVEANSPKSLDKTKVADLITSTIYHYPNAQIKEIRLKIAWKLSKLKSGVGSNMDIIDWVDYNPEDFILRQTNKYNGKDAENTITIAGGDDEYSLKEELNYHCVTSNADFQ